MENRQVIRSAGVVGAFTMLSRVLGLTRDVLMAGFFGTSVSMSAFVLAFTIPNLFRRLFGEGALSAAFIPVFIQTRQQEGPSAAWRLARTIFSLLTLLLAALALAGILVASAYLRRGGLTEQTALTLDLLRVMLPYMLFICLAALSMAMLNSCHHFAAPAFAPSLLNIVWILALWLVCPRLGNTPAEQIYGVAWAVLFAGMLQWAVQLPPLYRQGYRVGWSLDWRNTRTLRVFRLMGPASLGMAITQINVLIDRLMAAWIGPWAPAALFFSERLIYFPQGIFATALSTVLLPVFSGHAARADHARMRSTIQHALCNLLYVMIPASIGLFILARPIVQMIFEWKTFGDTSTDYTTLALMCYAPGLLVFGLSKVLVPAFYALQDTRTPVRVAAGCVALKISISLLLLWLLPRPVKHGGLALATVLAEAVNGVVLAVLIHRRLGSPGWNVITRSAGRALAGALVMAGVARFTHHLAWVAVTDGTDWPEKVAQILAVLVAIACGGIAYLGVTVLLRSPEITAVRTALQRAKRPPPTQ